MLLCSNHTPAVLLRMQQPQDRHTAMNAATSRPPCCCQCSRFKTAALLRIQQRQERYPAANVAASKPPGCCEYSSFKIVALRQRTKISEPRMHLVPAMNFIRPFSEPRAKKIDFTNHYFDFTLLNHWTSSHNDRATERGGLISCSHHCGGLRRRRLRGSRVSVNVCACVRACLFVSVCMYLCEHACSHVCMGV